MVSIVLCADSDEECDEQVYDCSSQESDKNSEGEEEVAQTLTKKDYIQERIQSTAKLFQMFFQTKKIPAKKETGNYILKLILNFFLVNRVMYSVICFC